MPQDSHPRSARAGTGLTDLAEGGSTIPRGRTRSLRERIVGIKRDVPRPSEEEEAAGFRGKIGGFRGKIGRNRRFPRENRAKNADFRGKTAISLL